MKIEWIGTGSGLNPTLGNTSFIVKSESRVLLVDCGSTVPIELIKSQYIGKITDVILTHRHADHIGGVEGFAFMHYFALRNRQDKRLNLYVATEEFAHRLWYDSLRGGMQRIVSDSGQPIHANLEMFFKVNIGEQIGIEGLPQISLFETPHVPGLANYGVRIPDKMFYSGDTTQLPSSEAKVIFQDCQFFESGGDVHISYDRLKRELSADIKRKTWLVHLGGGYEAINPQKDGFAGFVLPHQEFTL